MDPPTFRRVVLRFIYVCSLPDTIHSGRYHRPNCYFVSISLGLVLESRCSLSLTDLLITVADEVCPLLSDCLPLADMSCTERLSRVFHSFRRPFVRPSVRYQLSSETNHRISLIFCIKLALNKSKKVTEPDFPKKKLFGSNSRFLVNYSSLNH